MPIADITKGVRAYKITLSPKGDIAEEAEKKFCKWIAKTSDMCYIAAENGKNGQRHLHALVLYTAKREKSVLQNYIWQNQVKPYHPDSIQKWAVLVTAAYDFDWRDEYLHKEDTVELLVEKWDDAHCDKYLPTMEEQEALSEAKDCVKQGRAFHDHKHWSDLAGHFKTWYVKEGYPVPFTFVSPHHCLEFLNVEMMAGRMIVMVDPRRRQEKAIWLYRVVTGDTKPSDGEKQALDRWQNGNSI